jgi:hypothetical protein
MRLGTNPIFPVLTSPPTQRPEDAIPDTEENKEAREFLKNAPSKGLWLPFGKSVKVRPF